MAFTGTAKELKDQIDVGGSTAVQSDGSTTITGTQVIEGLGTGGLADYDLRVGDTVTTPTYGIVQIGNSTFGRTSFNAGSLDLDGTLLWWNNAAPATSTIEFAMADSSNNLRFCLAKPGVGNATYNPRSMLIAGPAALDDTIVTVGYWQAQGIFDNLVCDTSGDGADLGVQNDLEVEGDIFTDSIKESTTGAGITIQGHESGTDTFASAATKVVTFATAQADTNYRVALGPQANETFWVSTKTTAGFTLNSSNATSTAVVEWSATR